MLVPRTTNSGGIFLKSSEASAYSDSASARQTISSLVPRGLYTLAIAISVSLWFLAIRAPLWLDETLSFFIVKHRFADIFSRQGWPGVPAYPYLLWLWMRVAGTGAVALRMSSVLAMLAAVYLLYRSASELFDEQIGCIAAVLFCLHPIVNPAAIDLRPYAFAALAITASIFFLIRLRQNDSLWLAAMFGFSVATIVYFQFLFVVIVPAFAVCFLALPGKDRKTLWRQFGVALVVFTVAFLPVLPGLQYLFHTSGMHVFSPPPRLSELAQVMGQTRPTILLLVTLLIAAATRRLDLRSPLRGWTLLTCLSLSLIPLLLLFGISAATSIHVFVARYRLIAVPGVVLCWACVTSRIASRTLRLVFCLSVAVAVAWHLFSLPLTRTHNYTWKYALDVAEANASSDDAPALICSDLPEADFWPMPPAATVQDSPIFPQLSYYPLTVPVIPLPRSLNNAARLQGSAFLQQAAARHQRFLALAFLPSYPTLDWLVSQTRATHAVHPLGVFDGVKVLEFTPLPFAPLVRRTNYP